MYERNISIEDVKRVLNEGESIKEYPLDKPYPSKLILGKSSGVHLHLLVAQDDINKNLL